MPPVVRPGAPPPFAGASLPAGASIEAPLVRLDADIGPPAASLDDAIDDPFGLDAHALEDPGSHHNELDLGDLGEPIQLDDRSRAAPPLGLSTGAAEDIDLPTPAHVDLPTPATRRSTGSRFAPPPTFELPKATSDDLDLPAPVDLDLPDPDDMDALRPVGTNLPAPAQSNLVRPVGTNDLAPAVLDVAPRRDDALAPVDDLPRPQAGDALRPDAAARRAAASAAVAGGATTGTRVAPGSLPMTGVASPAPAREGVSKGLLVAVGGLLVLGIAGIGLLYSGVLEPQHAEPQLGSGPPATNDGAPPSAPGALGEPGEAVLADLRADRPSKYRAALATAHAAGDRVGEAEAALLLTYRYGPDPQAATRATQLIAGMTGARDPFVVRLMGLAALANHDLHTAATHLNALEDPRGRLYRGWLRLATGALDDAKADAEAVIAAHADDVAALHLRLAVQARSDPNAAIEALTAAIKEHPSHPKLGELATRTALDLGLLAEARTFAAGILPDDPPAGYLATVQALQGRVAAASGDFGGALVSYDAALLAAPEHFEAREGKVRALLGLGKLGDAATTAAALARDNPQSHEAALLHAEVAIAGGEGDLALQILAGLERTLAEDPRHAFLVGQVHAMRMDVEQARPAFQRAIDLDPMFFSASIAEARMLANARQVGDALGVFDTARKRAADADRSRDVAEIMIAKADVLAQSGQERAAIDALTQALDAEPRHNAAQVRRGTLRLAQGDRAEAKADLTAVFDRTGGFPGLAAPLGRLYLEAGELDALDALIGETLRGEDTPDDTLLVGARLRLAQGKVDEAKELVGFALARSPSDWEAHMVLAQVFIAEGNPSDALQEIDRARPSTPQAELYLNRAKILEHNAKHRDAQPVYAQALKLDPDLHEARYLYGRSLTESGAASDAIRQLQAVIDAPAAKWWHPRAHLELGRANKQLGKVDEAAKAFEAATAADDDLADAWAAAGMLAYQRNQLSTAIKALSKAIALHDDGVASTFSHADALADLGRAQQKSGKRSEAKATLEKFLEVAPSGHTARAEAQRLVDAM